MIIVIITLILIFILILILLTKQWRCSKGYGKKATKKRATFFATLLQNELNSNAARFTTHENKSCNLICCKTGSNVGGKTCNIGIQLVLQQCCKTSGTFFVARFTVA